MRIFGLIHNFLDHFRLLKTRSFFGKQMPFFRQISKVQCFISTIKPAFPHFINRNKISSGNQSTTKVLESKKIFTFKIFTIFYKFGCCKPLSFNILTSSIRNHKNCNFAPRSICPTSRIRLEKFFYKTLYIIFLSLNKGVWG
jgi:hypothetical protein